MITLASQRKSTNRGAWHAGFVKMMPAIQRHAEITFRDLDPEAREDAVHEVMANATLAYVRLYELGKTDVAFPSVLARYGVAQYRDGRKVGMRMNVHDVLSRYAQQKKGINVERLDHYCREEGQWREIVVEDKRSTPADIAACRIDFAQWLDRLPARQRRIASVLANGETTQSAAERFRVTAGRISQLRSELRESWDAFQGESSSATASSQR